MNAYTEQLLPLIEALERALSLLKVGEDTSLMELESQIERLKILAHSPPEVTPYRDEPCFTLTEKGRAYLARMRT